VTNDLIQSQLIVVFALIAAALAGEQQGARQERAAVVAYSSGWPYTGSYVPTAYSAYTAPVAAYSAYSSPYYGGVYGGFPAVRAYY
jgi:hypothetical protein